MKSHSFSYSIIMFCGKLFHYILIFYHHAFHNPPPPTILMVGFNPKTETFDVSAMVFHVEGKFFFFFGRKIEENYIYFFYAFFCMEKIMQNSSKNKIKGRNRTLFSICHFIGKTTTPPTNPPPPFIFLK